MDSVTDVQFGESNESGTQHVTDLLIATRPGPTGSTKTLITHRKYKDPGPQNLQSP